MAEKTIPQLPNLATVNENTLIPVDTGTQTFKATAEVLANYIAGRAEVLANRNLKKLLISNFKEVQSFSNIGTDWPDFINSIAFSPTGHCIAVSGNSDNSDRAILWATGALNNWAMSSALVSGVEKSWRRVIHVPELSRFYVVGNETASGDGSIGWLPQNNPAAGNILTSALADKPLYDVCYSPSLSRMLVVSPANDGTAAMISNDGTNFTSVSTPAGLGFGACAWSPTAERFVMGGFNQMAYSDNGSDWTSVVVDTKSSMIQKIMWVEELGLFVATTIDAIVLTSPNGEVWTQRNFQDSSGIFIYDLAYSPSLGLLVGCAGGVNQNQVGLIYFSENGIDWDYIQTLPWPSSYTLGSIAWIETQKMFLLGSQNAPAPFLIGKSLSHPGV